MRLHPTVPESEAYAWLREQARTRWGDEYLPELEEQLLEVAHAMSIISAFPLPDTAEPSFP